MKRLLILPLFLLAGCATAPLTPEQVQQQQFIEDCEKVGCVTVPVPFMMWLLNRAQGQSL